MSNKTLKVTFDKNVYEFVVHPEKEIPEKNSLTEEQREIFRKIHKAIIDRRVIPFISETILTYETVAKNDRQKILENNKPILVRSVENKIEIYSNPEIHLGLHTKDDIYLDRAIEMGFKILPGKRFGKLIHPSIRQDWYYYLEEEYLTTSKRFSTIVQEIEKLGAGYFQFKSLITNEQTTHLSRYERVKLYKGSKKKLSSAVAEWSDGDSVALHIAYNLDFFCTNDQAKNAGRNSVLGSDIYQYLNSKFGFEKVSPEELIKKIHSLPR